MLIFAQMLISLDQWPPTSVWIFKVNDWIESYYIVVLTLDHPLTLSLLKQTDKTSKFFVHPQLRWYYFTSIILFNTW